MNKKLMSSVLAGAMAVSTLSVAASAATATDKTVTAAGSTTFKVSATVAEAIIDVTIPSSMSAVVNPYGISVTTKTGVYGATGFTSPVYTIKNNTQTSAVMVSATPTITVPTTSVKDPDTKVTTKVPTIAVVATKEELADKEASKDKAIYAYVAGVDGTNVATDAAPTSLDVHDAEGALNGGAVVAVFEDATTDIKGATHTKSDIILIPKATAAVAANPSATPPVEAAPATYGYGQLQMGGDVTNTNITPWTKSDKISVNLVLDITPCKDDAEKGVYGNTVDDESTVTPGLKADIAESDFTGTGITAFAKGSAANEYDMTIDTTTNGGNAINLSLAALLDDGVTVTGKTADNANVTLSGLGANVAITPAGTGSSVVTITLSDTNTIVLNITLE